MLSTNISIDRYLMQQDTLDSVLTFQLEGFIGSN